MDVVFKSSILNSYVVHLSDLALGVLALILGTRIKRKQGCCETHGQDNGLDHFLFRAVIDIDVVEARRRLAYLARPGLTDLNRCSVHNPGTASLAKLNCM